MQHFRDILDPYSRESFTLYECKNCEIALIPNAPDNLGKYYDNRSGNTMREKPSSFTRFARERLFRLEFNPTLKKFEVDDQILDIGCGDGSLIDFLSHKFKNVSGADLYDKSNWKRSSPYQQLKTPDSMPDENFCKNVRLIIMRHVFEHVPNPQDYLQRLYQLGFQDVVVVVPNRNSIFSKIFGPYWYYWDPPRHLTHFSKKSLSRIGSQVGYSSTSSITHGIDEIFVSLHTFLLIKNHFRLAKVFKPTGLLSSLMSILTYPIGRGVIVHHYSILTEKNDKGVQIVKS
jgi:hypothetical protein